MLVGCLFGWGIVSCPYEKLDRLRCRRPALVATSNHRRSHLDVPDGRTSQHSMPLRYRSSGPVFDMRISHPKTPKHAARQVHVRRVIAIWSVLPVNDLCSKTTIFAKISI